MEFSASFDRTTKITSTLVCLLLLAVILAVHNIVLTCLSLLVIVLSYAYSPRGYVLADRSILVQRLFSNARIALDDVRQARRATPDDFCGCIRLWGSGGLFGYYGLFRTTNLGKSTWYVTNRSNAVVVITGAKTVLFSPDDPDGFQAALRASTPIPDSYAAASFEPARTFGSIGKVIAAAGVIAALGVAILATTYSPGVPSYTLTPESLTIHDRFYPVTLKASAVDVAQVRILDLTQGADWRPTQRTNGFANSHYRSGWFRVASGQKVRLYLANSPRVVLVPPKGDGTAVLYQAADPEKFVDQLRAQWSAPAQSIANGGK
jgi:hypothetical protein